MRDQIWKLHIEGKSYTDIANDLGLASKNVVAGQLTRYRAQHGIKVEKVRKHVEPITKTPPLKAEKVIAMRPGQPETPMFLGITLSEALSLGTCVFPHGDIRQSGLTFCGQPRKDGKPYCVHHHARTIQKARKQ